VVVFVVAGKYGIAGGACYRGYYIAFFSDECIKQRRFSGIGTTHNGKAGKVFGRLFGPGIGQQLQNFVEDIACSASVDGREGQIVAQPHVMKDGSLEVAVVIVDLIHQQQNGLFASAQHICHLLVERSNALGNVGNEEN